MTHLNDKPVALEALLLDPNNYRFQDYDDFVRADESRFHEPSVQDGTYARLRAEGLAQLRGRARTT